jgi:Cu-processing system permease protein
MKKMFKILKYCLSDLMRSHWILFYFLFYLLIGFGLLLINTSFSNTIITLLNIIIVLSPLISSVFGITYFYNSKNFTQLLLAQPIDRKKIFIAQYLGVSFFLSLSLILGLSIPFILFGILSSQNLYEFILLLGISSVLTFIFSCISFYIGILNNNKLRGFGLTVVVWLIMAVVYDGLIMILLMIFREYPLTNPSLIAMLLNPIDLARTVLIINLDLSALLGYTGASFKLFFGTFYGIIICTISLLIWLFIPLTLLIRRIENKDF